MYTSQAIRCIIELLLRHLVDTATDRTAASYFYALQNHLAGRIKSVRGPHALHKEKFSRGPHSAPSRAACGPRAVRLTSLL